MIFKSIWLPYIGKVNFSLGDKVEKIYNFLKENPTLKVLVDTLETPHLGIIHDVLNIPFYKRCDYLFIQWFLSYLFLSFQEELQRRKISTRIIPIDELVQTVEFFQFYFLVYNLGHLPYSFPIEEAIFTLNKELYFQDLKKLLEIYFSDKSPEIIQNTTKIILDSCEKSRRNIFYVNSLFIAHILKNELNHHFDGIEKIVDQYIKIALVQILNRTLREKQNSMNIFLKEKIDRENWTHFSRLFSYYRLLKRIRDLSIVLLDSQFAYSKFIFNTDYTACILNFIEDDQNIGEMLRILNIQLYQHPSVLYWDNALKQQILNIPLFKFQSINSIFLEKENREKIYDQVEIIREKIKNENLKIFPKSFIKYIKKSNKKLKINDFIRLLIINEKQDIKQKPQNIFIKIKEVIKKCNILDKESYKFIAEWLLWALSALLRKIKFAIEIDLNTTCFVIIENENIIKFISLGKKLVEHDYFFEHSEVNKLKSLIELIKNHHIKGFFFYSLDLVDISNNQQKNQIDYLFVFLLPDEDKISIFLGEDKDLDSKEHLEDFLNLLKDAGIFGDYLLEIHLIDEFKSFIENIEK